MNVAFIVVRAIDTESYLAEVALKQLSGEPKCVTSLLPGTTHAEAAIRALGIAVAAFQQSKRPWTIVVPDRAVVRMVTGTSPDVGRRVREIRRLLREAEGRVLVKYGRAAEVFGEFVDQLG